MLERMTIGRAELSGEINVSAELQHPVVIALENGLRLRRRELESLEILRLIRFEGFAVLFFHQRHAEHVDAIALPRALGIEHEGAGNVVVIMLGACHRLSSTGAAIRSFPYIAQGAAAAKAVPGGQGTDLFRALRRLAEIPARTVSFHISRQPIFVPAARFLRPGFELWLRAPEMRGG